MLRYSYFYYFSIIVLLAAGSCKSDNREIKPNIILIMADDMGFYDIECYGGEIATPVLDSLAGQGVLMTQFYNAARCCPSRAALMSGMYPHQVGFGSMEDQGPGRPKAYQGYLPHDITTMAEAFRANGYDTYLSGKWHLGSKEELKQWPVHHGFDHSWGLISGASSYYDLDPFVILHYLNGDTAEIIFAEDRRRIYDLPEDSYLTDVYTDRAMDYIDASVNQEKPFFLYLAYTAPHWPLQAPERLIKKYENIYNAGWEGLRSQRLNRLNHVIKAELSPGVEQSDAWDSLSKVQKEREIRKFATYAAMVESMDQNIGRLMRHLDQNQLSENTIVVFLSDNGGSAEDIESWSGWGEIISREGKIGTPQSMVSYGSQWANVSNTPFRLYKKYVHEGGISTPFIISYPKKLPANKVFEKEYAHIIDLYPTLLDIAGLEINNEQLEGVSLMPILTNQGSKKDRPIFWEHLENKAIRYGDWKAVKQKDLPWELYQMSLDRSELNDISNQKPTLLDSLIDLHEEWENIVGVYPKP